MNRLQKKCVISTAGIHLLLFVILIVGPAFFNRQPKADNTVLDMIPANLVDAAINSGVQDAQPPPPTPLAVPQPPQPLQPIPLPPKIVQPPAPAPTPAPSLTTRIENYFRSPPPQPTPDLKPAQRTEPQPPKIQVNLTPATRTAAQRNQQQQQDNSQNQRQINNTLRSLSHSLSSATKVDVPGTSSTSAANYKDALATIYYNAWVTPDNTSSDQAIAKVRITVATDGTVINAEIISPSGDASTDQSVRQALDRVSSVPPLPDQSKAQQEFIIDFNLKTKRMLE